MGQRLGNQSEPMDSKNQPSKSSSPTDLHPATSSTDPIHSERQPVPLDRALHQEVIHNWTEKVKAKLRSGNRTKEFLCEVRRDIGHILVLKKFDTPHERNAFIRSLVKEPSKEEELVAWLQEAKPTNPNDPGLEECDSVPGAASTQRLPAAKTLLETSGGSSPSGTSSSIQGDSSGAPSPNVTSAGLFRQFNPNSSSLQFPNLQVGTGSLQFGSPGPGISVKNLPPAPTGPAPPSAPDPLTSFLTSQRGLPGSINAQTVPIPSIPELDPKPVSPPRGSRSKPEGPKRKPGRPLGSTKMAMIQRKREDRKRAEESRLQAQQDIFPVPRSPEELAQIEKEGSEIARGLLLANLQISMDAEGQARTEKGPAIGKEVPEPETSEAPVQPEKRVLRKRKSGAELISSANIISDESTPSGSTENPSRTTQPQPTSRQAKCSKIPRKPSEDNPSSEYLEAKRIIKALMRKDNRKASRSGKKKIQECEVPTVPIDYAKTFDEMVERVMKADIEDIVGPPAKRRRRSTTGSTAQGSGGTKNKVPTILHGADIETGESKKPGRGARRSRKKSVTTKTQTPEGVVADAGQSNVLEQISGEIGDSGASDSPKILEPDELIASSSQQIDEGVSETVIQHTSSCQEPSAPLPIGWSNLLITMNSIAESAKNASEMRKKTISEVSGNAKDLVCDPSGVLAASTGSEVSSNDVREKTTSDVSDASDNSNRIPADDVVLQTQKKPNFENSVSEDRAVRRQPSQSEEAGTANGKETAPEEIQVAASEMDKFDDVPSNNATNTKEYAPGRSQVAVIDTSSPMEFAGTATAEESAPEGIQVAASTIDNLHDAPLKDAGASEVPKSSVVVKRNQLNQEEACEMAHGTTETASAVILEDVSKNTESPKATHPSETKAVIPLKSPELVSETVPNSMCQMSPESTPKLIPDATIEALIEKIRSNQVEASETVIERLKESVNHTVKEPNIQGSNTPETASFEQPSPVREMQKTVSETGVTLDVRTSEASFPQEPTVGPENLQILENQAHQDQLTDSLVEDEDPNKSDGSEAVQSEVSASLIKNSASASTEKTMPEDPISMEALTNPEASRIISSADMEARGSEEGTGEPPAGSVEQDEPSHSADQLDPDFNFARRREMERIEMERMYKEMRKKPLCQSFCRRPDDNFLTSETFRETVPDSESVNSSTSSLKNPGNQIASQANVSQPVDQSSSQDVEPFAEINGRRPEPRQELLQPELLNGMENCTESAGLTSSTTTDAPLMVSPNIPTNVVPPALSESPRPFVHPGAIEAQLPSGAMRNPPPPYTAPSQAAVSNSPSANSTVSTVPIQAHPPVPTRTSSEPVEPTGSGMQVDVPSWNTDSIVSGTLDLLENQQQNDLESNAIPRTAAPEVSTSLVPNSSTSNAAPTSTTIVSTWVPPFATATSFSGIREKSQEASSMVAPGPSVIQTTPTVPHPGMHTLPSGVVPFSMEPMRHPPPPYTADSQPDASNSPPINSTVPIALLQAHVSVPSQTFAEPLEFTGNGIQVAVSSLATDPTHLDSIPTASSAKPSLQQALQTPESDSNSESRIGNSTSSVADSFAALQTGSSQTASEMSELSVNQQNDHGANVTSSAAAPEASISTVSNSSTSDSVSAATTTESHCVPTPDVPHTGMFPLSPVVASTFIGQSTTPSLHQEIPAHRIPPSCRTQRHASGAPRNNPDFVQNAQQLPDAMGSPRPAHTAASQAAASNLRPAHSIASIISVQAHSPVPTRTPSKPLEFPGNDLQMDASRSSSDPAHPDSIPTTSSATGLQTSTSPGAPGTSQPPGNQENGLEANMMVYTAASEVPTSTISSSSTSCVAPAVTTADASFAATETSRQQKNQEAPDMLPSRSSMPQTTPAIPHPGMFPLPPGMTPSGPPRAPPHHSGVPVRQVPQGSFMHPWQFLPGSNFMHSTGAPRMHPNFAQNPMNVWNMHPGAMRHQMVPPPPYTAASQATPFNLPPVNSTVPMAYMQGHFPFPPRPEVAAQWMAAHSMPQHKNNPIVPTQKTPKRARKPRTKAAPRNDTVVSIPIASSPPAAVPVPPIVQMIAPQPEVYQNPQASSIRRVFNTMPRSDQAASPDSSSSESMPRLEADGEEEETVREEAGPTDQSSPEAPPPKNSRFDEDLSKMICRDEAIHEALKNAPRAKSRILPLEEITPSDEECPDLEFFKSFVDRSQSFGEMNRCTVTCAEMFSSEFTNLVEKRGQQKRRFHKNEEFRKTLEGVKAVAMFEMAMQDNLIAILNKWPEARQEPKFQLFLQAHEMTGHKAIFNNENEAEAEKNLVIRTLNYLSDLSREKNFGCNEIIAILLYAIHKFVGCCYPVQGFRLIHQILETYIKPRDENIEFQDLD